MTSNQEASGPSWVAWLLVAIWSLAMIWIAASSGVQHDYRSYLVEWDLVLAGRDPWSTDNAYGPLHNLLAVLLPLGPLAPKLLIVTALLAANMLLVRALHGGGDLGSRYGIYLLAVPTNCLVIIMGAVYGLNDTLVAALVACAVVARHRGRPAVAGCVLGLAVLLKYYPLVLVPLFALEAGRFRARLVLAAAAVTLIGLGAAALVWGGAVLQAITFAAAREPSLLSILSPLDAHPSLIGGRPVVDFLVTANIAFVAAAAVLSVLVATRARIHWLEASVLGLLVVLVVYKVGHPQFWLPWLILVAALPLAATPSARRLAWLCVPLVLFLSAFQAGYTWGSDHYRLILGFVRQDVGFVAFALGLATIAAYFGFAWTPREKNSAVV
jgi:hypothetical protein